jgi:hypothetical protein
MIIANAKKKRSALVIVGHKKKGKGWLTFYA